MRSFQIMRMTSADWMGVRGIYAEGLATGVAAFANDPPEWDEWDEGHLPVCRFVARAGVEENAGILGWSALSPIAST